MRVGVLAVVLALAGYASAQRAPDPSGYGSVVGHVWLPESNRPARLANVALQSSDMESHIQPQTGGVASLPVSVVQTGLDGSFRMDRVLPGRYYVVVNLPGFLSPIAQFTPDQLKNPPPGLQQKILATVPTVEVMPGNTASADVRLSRGASLSGMVRYDDGSATPAVVLALMKRNANGHWDPSPAWNRPFDTDDEGHFRLSGLAPGEYRLKVTLDIRTQRQNVGYGQINSVSSSLPKSSITFYSGDTALESEARVLTLTEGQALTGQDITIPVSKLHAVSGAVVDAHTGQALNSGYVSLVMPDGHTLVTAQIDAESRSFTFSFAPEGEYTLQARMAQEALPTRVVAGLYRYQKPLRTYDEGKIPIVIHGDVTGITVPVIETPAPAGTSKP